MREERGHPTVLSHDAHPISKERIQAKYSKASIGMEK